MLCFCLGGSLKMSTWILAWPSTETSVEVRGFQNKTVAAFRSCEGKWPVRWSGGQMVRWSGGQLMSEKFFVLPSVLDNMFLVWGFLCSVTANVKLVQIVIKVSEYVTRTGLYNLLQYEKSIPFNVFIEVFFSSFNPKLRSYDKRNCFQQSWTKSSQSLRLLVDVNSPPTPLPV